MPVTDILNPTTVLTNNAVVSSANALAVKVISGGGSGITINTSTITGGTTTRLLYDNGATVGETAGVTYASVSSTMTFADTGTWSSFGITASAITVTGIASAGTLVSAGNVFAAAGGLFEYVGRTGLYSPGDGQLVIATNALSSAVGIDVNTPGVFKIRSSAFSADAGLTASTGGFTGNVTITAASLIYGGVTFASTATGSGSLVGGTNPTLSSLVATGTLTYGGVTLSSAAPTGTGVMVLATNPTLSSLVATGTLTYGGVALASTVTGTGSMVLSASPTLSGTASFAATVHSGLATFSSAQTTVGTGTFQNAVAASASVVSTAILFSSTASFGIIFGALGSVAPTLATSQGTLLLNTTGSSVASRMFIRTSSSWSAVTTAA